VSAAVARDQMREAQHLQHARGRLTSAPGDQFREISYLLNRTPTTRNIPEVGCLTITGSAGTTRVVLAYQYYNVWQKGRASGRPFC
jgi:hypothetical protein